MMVTKYFENKDEVRLSENLQIFLQESIDESINEDSIEAKSIKKREEKQIRKENEEIEMNQQECTDENPNDKEPNAQDVDIANTQELNGILENHDIDTKNCNLEHKRFKSEEENIQDDPEQK